MTAEIVQFPQQRQRLKKELLSALNQVRQLENAYQQDIDVLIDVYMIAMAQDLYKIGVRWEENSQAQEKFQQIFNILQACIYENEGYDHHLQHMLPQIMQVITNQEERDELENQYGD